jgi:hypothetical protein
MPKTIQLASGQITRSPDNTIRVELLDPVGESARVSIVWPATPTVCAPAQLDTVIAKATLTLTIRCSSSPGSATATANQ